jgi:hypothetical protein
MAAVLFLLNPPDYGHVSHTKMFCRLSSRLENVSFDVPDISFAAITLLLDYGRPPNIAGLITEIVIYAVDLVIFARAFTDVGEEGFKAVTPLLTDKNPSTAIGGKIFICPNVASAFNGGPCSIFFGVALAVYRVGGF